MTKESKRSAAIILVAWLAYLVSYLGRSDYSACILAIVNETGVSRATAGLVSSSFAICNAFGQLASGFVMGKISPVKVIAMELVTVFAVNLLFPVTDSFAVMAVLWGINGAMQATLLCGVTQIMANTLKEPYLSRGVVLMNTIGAVGGLFNYVLSFSLIRSFGWRGVFLTVSGLLMVMGIAWCTAMPKLVGDVTPKPMQQPKKDKTRGDFRRVLLSYGGLFAIIGAFFVGSLRESVSLWIPSYMSEIFRLDSSLSTVLTAVVPCTQICGAFLGGRVGRTTKTLQLPACAAFVCSTLCLLTIRLLGSASPAITLVLFAINAVSMTAALTFLLSLFPVRYAPKHSMAVLVGVINFAVHMGDFAASTGIGWLSQFGGWQYTFFALCVAAGLGALICLAGGAACLKEAKSNGKARI